MDGAEEACEERALGVGEEVPVGTVYGGGGEDGVVHRRQKSEGGQVERSEFFLF